ESAQHAAPGNRRSFARLERSLDQRIIHRRERRIVIALAVFALPVPVDPTADIEPLPRGDHHGDLSRRGAIVFDPLEPRLLRKDVAGVSHRATGNAVASVTEEPLRRDRYR